MELQEKIKAIADHYGFDIQILRLAEECSGYSSTINKLRVCIACTDVNTGKTKRKFKRLENVYSDDCRKQLAVLLVITRQIEYLIKNDQSFNEEIERLMHDKANKQLKQIEDESK